MNIYNINPAAVSVETVTLQYKIECLQRVWREWGHDLSLFEHVVLLQLIDRTIGWGRLEAYFTNRALLEGDGIYKGVPMGRSKLFETLASLDRRGIIRRRKDPKVPDRVHYSVNMKWKPETAPVAISTRLDDGTDPVHNEDYPVRDVDYPVPNADPIYSTTLTVSSDSNQPGATAPVSLIAAKKDRAIASVPSGTIRARLQTNAQTPQAGVDAVDAAWRLALIETFPGTAYRTWGVREKAQIKIVLKNWRGDATLPEFVDWAVRNWTAIIAKHFKWMTDKKPPAAPALGFLIAFIDRFADARAEGVLEKWQSADQRTYLERLMARGQTYEQANRQVATENAARGLRVEMEKREIHARARDYAATRKLAEAAKLAALEGRVPIHPQSQLAKEARAHARPVPVNLVEVGKDAAENFQMLDMSQNPFDD